MMSKLQRGVPENHRTIILPKEIDRAVWRVYCEPSQGKYILIRAVQNHLNELHARAQG
jgi:hypothetical protein